MRKYRLVAKKGEGTFSEVLKAQNVKDGKYHAIKCMKNHFDSIDQVNNLREIQARSHAFERASTPVPSRAGHVDSQQSFRVDIVGSGTAPLIAARAHHHA